MVAPTKPRRAARPRPTGDGGCGPCAARRCQIHLNLVTTQTVTSPWDKKPRKIMKKLDCSVPNLVYYLVCFNCPSGVTPHYTGSTVKFPARWSAHKGDLIRGRGKCCGFCEHWKVHHSHDYTDLSHVRIHFLDSCVDPGSAADFYPLLRNLEERWMVQMGSLGALDPVQGCNKKDDAKAKARTRGN